MSAAYSDAVVHVHGLDADPAGSGHLGQVHAVAAQHAGLELLLDRVHLDRGVLVQEAARLDQDLLAGLERLLEDVAVAVQQEQARVAGGDEPVHVHAAAAVQDVGQALDPHERVVQRVRAGQEGVLADVDLMRRVNRQHDDLAGRVLGQRDPAGAVRDAEDVRHAADHPAGAAGSVQRRQRDARLLPQHDVVLEEHRVALRQRELGDRDDLALDLAGGVGEPELRHVPQPGSLGPARVGDDVLLVERGAAGGAARPLRLVLSLAPLTFDPVHPGRPFCSRAFYGWTSGETAGTTDRYRMFGHSG